MELSFEERRVLGVLIEKSFATPEQYPLTLNALVNGANQKSCRDPVAQLDEEAVVRALDSLREKELVTLVRSTGGRTDRYKHRLSDTLELEGKEAAVLAELLLRGPQTDGELRQHASRLKPFSGLEEIAATLDGLQRREPPLVRRLSPEGRRRGVKFAHTLYPPGEEPSGEDGETGDVTGVGTALGSDDSRAPVARPGAATGEVDELRREVAELRSRVEDLESTIAKLTGL